VIILVIWAVAVAALVAAAVQLLTYRQAMLGYDVAGRVRARWAARAGVENTIASLEYNSENPLSDDPFALYDDLSFVSAATMGDGESSYSIVHHLEGRNFNGPKDEAGRANINREGLPIYDLLEDMSPDQAAAITDWVDEDDEPSMFGAEEEFYRGRYSYSPRNGLLRSLAELELIAGVWPHYVRGEDFNLNGRLDPNENDGEQSLPDDSPDDYLDTGWSRFLTAYSVDHGSSLTGLPRIHLRRAMPEDVMERLGVTEMQARALISFGKNPENVLELLLTTPLANISPDGSISQEEVTEGLQPLTTEQLKFALSELRIEPEHVRRPGRINVNTAPPDLIRELLDLQGFDEVVADELIHRRNGEGLLSLVDISSLTVELTSSQLNQLATLFTTTSDVFSISCVGRDTATGAESEIIVVVDRSTLPLRIVEYREQ